MKDYAAKQRAMERENASKFGPEANTTVPGGFDGAGVGYDEGITGGAMDEERTRIPSDTRSNWNGSPKRRS